MKKNPCVLSYRPLAVSSAGEAVTEFDQEIDVPPQEDTKQIPAMDEDEIVLFPLPVLEKIDEQEPDETSEEEEDDDDDEEDDRLANVWLN